MKQRLIVDLGPMRARALDAWQRGAATPGDAGLPWLERAHRLAPSDQNLRFALAMRRLETGDGLGAADLLGPMAHRFGVPECWAGLAAARLALNEPAAARAALHQALSTCAADDALASLADLAAPLQGWCGLRMDGTLLTSTPNPSLALDDIPIPATSRLPDGWHRAQSLTVRTDAGPLLGSPIAIATIRRLEGFASRTGNTLAGTAWHPAAPGHDPVLHIRTHAGTLLATLTATQLQDEVDGDAPLVRQRVFTCDIPADTTVHVIAPDGRDLLGSPLPPASPTRRRRRARPITPRHADPTLPVAVIIPVYRGLQTTLDCIASVLATTAPPHRVLVVDDASPEPALVAALHALAADGRIELLHTGHPTRNAGFPAAVNTGLRAAASHHAILLNSDTLVGPRWLERLRAAACSAPDIGTATPLSNEASIFSTPNPEGGNPAPDLAATATLARLAAEACGAGTIDVPTAHGFCMFIRADCLAETGLFDDTSFAQGYGEENDFTERARLAGWRHVAVPGVFVAHYGGLSFGGARLGLLARNLDILSARYPTYRARVDAFIAADPLRPARRRLDAARWLDRAPAAPAVLLITHGLGGGTERVVGERAAALRAGGFSPVVLRSADGLCLVGEADGGYPNLAYALPRELPALAALLRPCRPAAAELHHLYGHDHSILQLLAQLGVAYDAWVHDYAWFCARLSFVTGEGRFCGEADTATCDICVATWGRGIEDPVSPAELRRRSAADLAAARTVIVPSDDVARRVGRHAPRARLRVTPWEADPPPAPPAVVRHESGLHIAVVGAIGIDKGFEVLLACARDAAARALDLRFTVIGYTIDDDALMATGRAFVTGEFNRAEATRLIAAQAAHLALIPSIWPETWCYALSDVWAAGLSAAVFDIGTPAARVRATGRGWVLPLGLPADRVNDALKASGPF